MTENSHAARYQRLIELGIALSAERDHNRLLEKILLGAKEMAEADGGTLYLRQDDSLAFAILRNDSLGIAKGGTTDEAIPFAPLQMYGPDGTPNHNNVCTHVALTGELVTIADAYDAEGFDFSGTRTFDASTGYRSRSFLTVPLKRQDDRVIGVLQLINALDPATGEPVPFDPERVPLVEALASQAAVALNNQQLIEAQRRLLDSFIRVIADAIDAKSPYTGGHCKRVPVVANMLAQAAHDADSGPLAGFYLGPDDAYEINMAAWLHDCGKIVTPEYVMDKGTKLEALTDRMETVRTRYEVLRRDALIEYYREGGADDPAAADALEARLRTLDDELSFLEGANKGGEFLPDDTVARLEAIAERRWRDAAGEARPVLSADEVYHLSIRRGTLTPEEYQVIKDHVSHSIAMLEKLPFPEHLKRVPEYAGGHHERLDGKGYPRGLTAEELSTPARIMAIADVFEALTAADRPYKTPKTLSEALKILGFMAKDRHIDPALFRLFVESGIWRDYAEQYLKPEQLDSVDTDAVLAQVA